LVEKCPSFVEALSRVIHHLILHSCQAALVRAEIEEDV
jgi:hypothetical protein